MDFDELGYVLLSVFQLLILGKIPVFYLDSKTFLSRTQLLARDRSYFLFLSSSIHCLAVVALQEGHTNVRNIILPFQQGSQFLSFLEVQVSASAMFPFSALHGPGKNSKHGKQNKHCPSFACHKWHCSSVDPQCPLPVTCVAPAGHSHNIFKML